METQRRPLKFLFCSYKEVPASRVLPRCANAHNYLGTSRIENLGCETHSKDEPKIDFSHS